MTVVKTQEICVIVPDSGLSANSPSNVLQPPRRTDPHTTFSHSTSPTPNLLTGREQYSPIDSPYCPRPNNNPTIAPSIHHPSNNHLHRATSCRSLLIPSSLARHSPAPFFSCLVFYRRLVAVDTLYILCDTIRSRRLHSSPHPAWRYHRQALKSLIAEPFCPLKP